MNSHQKIPGYSGFIPYKQDLVGLTTGESNRNACEEYRNTRMGITGQNIMSVTMRSNSINGSIEKGQRNIMVGNKSKDSNTWLNGPKHNIRNQCIPGYTGFISGVKSENLFSRSYADNTAKSFKGGKITRGADFSPEKRFITMN